MQQYQEIRYGSEVGGGEDEDGAGLEGESLVADGRGPGSASNTAASAASERRFGPGANPAAAQAAAEGLDEAALDAAWSLPSVVGYLYALVDRANADFAAAAAASASGAAPAPAAAAASGAQAATHSAAGGTWAHPSSSFRQQVQSDIDHACTHAPIVICSSPFAGGLLRSGVPVPRACQAG
jgi:hypothetical protein